MKDANAAPTRINNRMFEERLATYALISAAERYLAHHDRGGYVAEAKRIVRKYEEAKREKT